MRLLGGRKWYTKEEDGWLWEGDSLAHIRGALRIRDPRDPKKTISLIVETEDVVGVPRYFPVTSKSSLPPIDDRYLGPKIDIEFRDRADLRKRTTLSTADLQRQKEAADALSTGKGGYVVAPPGAGKTVIGSRAICSMQRRALVIVNTKHLLHQWRDRLKDFTTAKQVGMLQGAHALLPGSADLRAPVGVAMVQTLNNLPADHPVFRSYGVVIVDEAHESPAFCFYSTMLKFYSRHLWALTATPDRTDGLWHLVPWVVGKCAYTITSNEVPTIRWMYTETPENMTPYGAWLRDQDGNAILMKDADGNPVFGKTGLAKGVKDSKAYMMRGKSFWPYLLNYIALNPKRNEQIAKEIRRCVKDGRNVILLTDRKEQTDILFGLVEPHVPETGVITAETQMGDRKTYGKRCRVILATMGCLKKGADFPRFDTLVYGTPFSSSVTAIQTAGRVFARGNPDKKPPLLVIPYDKRIGASARCTSALERNAIQRGWREEGDSAPIFRR